MFLKLKSPFGENVGFKVLETLIKAVLGSRRRE
jgi:hypothetical protein